MVPIAVLTQSKPISITAVRPVSAAVPKIKVTRPRHAYPIVTKSKSPIRRHITCSLSSNTSTSLLRVTAIKALVGNPQHALQDKGVIDSGCSRHMTGNMSYLSDFKELNGGYVAFGVTQRVFPDESQVLLRVPRENNMYNLNLKNIVPFGDLTCLFAKATINESNLWHRRLGHINFKTINKLVKGNLVRGLPTKVFENDNTRVACKKGKQHRASCKTKPVSSVDQPLYRLHMDLFGPNFVKCLNKKSYCLVVTDDYSRFTWVFFLATKDETSPILKTFITGLENQLSLKVKVIRSDNGTEFKNNDLNQFCGMKGIKREFSVPRTPQQNGIAERKNRTLIEAARTMLADSLLPIPFWTEAVNTACYVQNKVLVTKPHNKTLYELLHGRTPSIGFIRPFGCPMTILNTLDSLGKFKGKVDERFLVGYSVSSKAFIVFNSRTRIVQETLHVNFLENKPNVAGFQDKLDAEKVREEIDQQYVLFPVWSSGFTNPQNNDGDAAFNGKEHDFDAKKPESEVNVSPSSSAQSRKQDDKTKKEPKGKSPVESFTRFRDLSAEFEDCFDNSINEVNAAGSIVPTVGQNSLNSTNTFSAAELEDITYSDDENDVGAEVDFNNLETSITVSPIPTTRVHKDHYVSQIIGDLSSTTQTRSMTRVVKDQGGLLQMFDDDFHTCMFSCFLSQEEPKRVHQALKDPSWIEAMQEELLQFKMQKVWVLVDLPHGKEPLKVFANIRKVGKGFSGVETPLFKGMLVEQEIEEEGDADEHVEEVNTGDATHGDDSDAYGEVSIVTLEPSIPSPTPPTSPPQPSQDIPLTSQAMDACVAVTRRVEHLEYDKVAQALEITKLKRRVKKLEKRKKVRVLKLRRLQRVGTSQRVETSNDTVMDDESKQGRMIAKMHQDDAVVLKDDKEEDKEVADVVKDVEEANVNESAQDQGSETVTATSAIIPTAEPQVPAATLIATPARIATAHSKKRKGVMDEQYARELHAKLNKDIDWDESIDHVKRKAKEDPAVKRYQAMKRKPQTKAQARKNMMMYLKNVAGFKMDYFKGMSYDDIHPIFEAKFNSNVAFLLKTKEQIEEDENRALQKINETPTERATKRRKLDEEVEDLKRHLQIVPNEDDDVYTEATPLARKVLVVDYEIIKINNQPYYKIIRADGTHQLYISFLTLLRNFNREDLKALWSLVKERFSTAKPKNFFDDFLLTTLGAMFETPNAHAQIWKNQRSVHGQAKVKSWKLLESCGVQIITFTTTHLILLVKRRMKK
nr:putative ribonuclease H-like domain-containing protein [Tanacetum cinerariifolium]